jgi:3-deoxy-manno-octulosonate cytidylyltransferase (CMP-KDO synthetase)
MFSIGEQNRSMIFNPLIVVASELGIPRSAPRPRDNGSGESAIVRAYRRTASAELGSVIVDSTDDADAAAAAAAGAYTVKTDLGQVDRLHNYRSNSGAERIAATVNRFDRYYTHDVVIAVSDDMPELKPFYLQALMYALATTEVGIAVLVSPLKDGEFENKEITKIAVDWNPDRIVYPLEGGRVGTLRDIRRDPNALRGKDCARLVPVYAWRRAALDRVISMPPTDREFAEGTDLVRALDAGIRVDVSLVWEDMKVLIGPAELRGDNLDMGH